MTQRAETKKTRSVKFEISEELLEQSLDMAKSLKCSLAEVIRASLKDFIFFKEEQRKGNKLLIEDTKKGTFYLIMPY